MSSESPTKGLRTESRFCTSGGAGLLAAAPSVDQAEASDPERVLAAQPIGNPGDADRGGPGHVAVVGCEPHVEDFALQAPIAGPGPFGAYTAGPANECFLRRKGCRHPRCAFEKGPC